MKVYVLIESDYDVSSILGVYTNEIDAEGECGRLWAAKDTHYSGSGLGWHVEEFEVQHGR